MPYKKNIKLAVINGKAITTSREVAIYFNKRHSNVLRDIENLDCSPQFSRLNFESAKYEDSQGEARKEYQITRNGFIFLAMGFTGKYAGEIKEAYIYAFDEMELELHRLQQTAPQQAYTTVNDVLKLGSALEETTIKIFHTRQGEIINVTQLKQQSTPEIPPEVINNAPTMPKKPLWIPIVEAFFDQIANESIPEKMRQNMLLTNEVITSPTGKREKHACLFFRASNVIAFFSKDPRFFDVMNASLINTAQELLTQLDKAGVLAFGEKSKEKGIPINPNTPSEVRRVPHLVALDLVVLERDYGVVMASSGEIAKTLR